MFLLSLPGPGDGDGEPIDSVVVTASRAGHDTPIPHATLPRSELKRAGASASIPRALEMQPSVISTSEGGTSLGYTALRIRGVTGSQTGVSLNGIPLNDAESQEVFWVNTPALVEYLGSVQLQRGLGTTACGPGAFGASVNMVTDKQAPDGRAELSYGSFGTFTGTVVAPVVRSERFRLAGACSYQRTDGWIRNASARNGSAFVTAGWDCRHDSFSAMLLFGKQHTGITWEGIPQAVYEAGNLTYNPAGEHLDSEGNVLYYGNQCDNYRQLHAQLQWKHSFSDSLRLETTLNNTGGYGYYEQYKLAQYEGDTVTRDILDNSFWALRSELAWTTGGFVLNAGAFASIYSGDHLGLSVPSSVISGTRVPRGAWDGAGVWYSNDALKTEADLWLRGEWRFAPAFTAYGELQLRAVRHIMTGPDEYGQTLDYDHVWPFVNPRLGLSWRPGTAHRAYASAALGHREPGRADLQASSSVRQEKLLDFEAGWEYSRESFRFSAGLYAMEYHDMLLETGRLNDAGYAVKENAPRAWRRGVEFSAAWRPLENLGVSGNLALSTNKIREYTAYIDCYDADWNFLGQTCERYLGAPIRLSPSAVAAASLEWTPSWMSDGFRLSGKYVGPQQWDNTGAADRRVPAYCVCDFSAGRSFMLDSGLSFSLRFDCNNLFGRTYYAYAWVWNAQVAGEPYRTEGVFPQPPRTFTLTVSAAF